jgi:ribulose kinase
MEGGNQYFKMKMMLTWHYHGSCKLIALKLHNNYSYIVVIELHKLHMYMVSHMVGCIRRSSCNLSNNTHAHKNTLSCNELYNWITNGHYHSKTQLQGQL